MLNGAMSTSQNSDTPQGFAFAISAYFLWGFLPLYMKLLDHVPAAEVVLHRIVWSLPIAGVVLVALGRTSDIRTALTNPRMLAMGALTAALVTINWGIYVWAIVSGNALEAALGYYINPLFSVFLGFAVLGERLTRLQVLALALVAAAVLVLTLDAGVLPWTAIGLFVSWGLYALCKRRLPIGPNQGFLLEIAILTPFALAYWAWLAARGESHFDTDLWLLLGCGAVTAIPLLLYANGAKRLRLATIAILQYIAPTMILLCAVFAFGEPFGTARAIAFPMIWVALILYTYSMLRERHGQ